MNITRMKTNRVVNPLGFSLGKPHLSFVVTETKAKKQTATRYEVALDDSFLKVVYDSGKREDIDSLAFELPIVLEPYTRYYWRVEVWADNGDHVLSETAWFETAKMDEPWTGKWITPEMDKEIHPVLTNTFNLSGEMKSARAYVCGLGLYEMHINGEKAGDEYFAPHFNAYKKWLQYQTYDITSLLRTGDNVVEVMLGNGLYKGRFGFDGRSTELYGNEFALLCEIVITYIDDSTEKFGTDLDWKALKSRISSGNLYDGEVYDSTLNSKEKFPVKESDIGYDRLQARLSLPVIVKEELKPIDVIYTPAGEIVIDMGQNMVGWVRFTTNAPKGTIIKLQYGEVLQEGNFYSENYRTAKAEYVYTADGTEAVVQPNFTYYGFRYVKVEGWVGELSLNNFTGCVVYSDLEDIGDFETSNPLVNRLFLNAKWGQKGNFVDVPTDCPQRDEKMGWTGDAQVFSGTACFNMDTYAFYAKYGYDMALEQEDRGGMVPMVVPAANVEGGGSSAWADAATIIPWNVYLHYGDKGFLEQQFVSMKSWVDFIIRADEESGGKRLWTVGFQFGDWLALDGSNSDSPMGGTDTDFVASAYYRHSSLLLAKAARVLGKHDLAEYYNGISEEVKTAIENEFFSKNGRLGLDTQTSYVLALYMDLAPEAYKARVIEGFRKRLKMDRNHLKTGFVGTPYLNQVLSDAGCNDLAYTLLLNEDYPSWLYAVKLGATTIWERWDSILPDGKISSSGMNSLNHYAYGAIAEWMYRTVAGFNPVEEAPGFRKISISPKPDFRLQYAKASLNSAAGRFKSEWSFENEGILTLKFEIPFNATALVKLPRAVVSSITVNDNQLEQSNLKYSQQDEETHLELDSGYYQVCYVPNEPYVKLFNTHTPLVELLQHNEAKIVISHLLPLGMDTLNPDTLNASIGDASLRSLASYYPIDANILDELDGKLASLSMS